MFVGDIFVLYEKLALSKINVIVVVIRNEDKVFDRLVKENSN